MPPLNYGTPVCPQSQQWTRDPEMRPCPRSDTYRAIENGDAHNVWGWLFRCRTCGNMFFRASREAGEEGLRAGRLEQLMRGSR